MTLKRIVVQERHPAKKLEIDSRVQRELIPARVKRISNDLRAESIGVVTVSKRVNGDRKNAKYIVLDGQHRIAALLASDMGDTEVACHVHMGLTLAEEASLFRDLNNTRRTTAFDDFTKGVIARDSACLEINGILARHGLRVTDQSQDGGVRAVAALRKVHAYGDDVLSDTLAVLTAAWGTTIDAVDGALIQGVGLVFKRYGDAIDTESLVRKLAKMPAGPMGLIGDARGLTRLRPGSVSRCVAIIVIDLYNRGRRVGQLAAL